MIQRAGQFGEGFCVGGGRELGFDTVEFAVGLHNLGDVVPFALQKEENAGQAIKQFSGKDAATAFAGMQIFVKHQQVVAKIQKGFSRTLVGEGGAADVEDAGGRAGPNAVAHQLQSPAQIDFFHVGEKG